MSYLIVILIFTVLSLFVGALLGIASEKLAVKENPVTEKINEALPQIQCGQCGYAGCKQYAEAVAKGETTITKCTPGGQDVINALAEILGIEPISSDEKNKKDLVAFIDENECIGCGKCARVCPVAAIAGAVKMKHAVISEKCTGCEKCESACPTKCIQMTSVPDTPDSWNYKLSDAEWEN